MYMSNADIVKEYKEAKDRSAQVKILADQNCCSTERHVRTLLNKYKDDDVTIKSSVIRDDLIDICPEALIDTYKRKKLPEGSK